MVGERAKINNQQCGWACIYCTVWGCSVAYMAAWVFTQLGVGASGPSLE